MKLFSYIFHPIFVPLFGTLFYLLFADTYLSNMHKILLVVQVVIITILLPIVFFVLLKKIGKVDTVMIANGNQRKIPLLLQIVLTTVLLYRSIKVEVTPDLYYFFLEGICSAVITYLLLFFNTKASIHMLGMGALTVFLIFINSSNSLHLVSTIAFIFLATGFVASSRLIMQAHTIKELVIGYLVGILPQIGLFYFL